LCFSIKKTDTTRNQNPDMFDLTPERVRSLKERLENQQLTAEDRELYIQMLEVYQQFSRSVSSQDDEKSSPVQDKIGRNESCPCGSGKKYKRCCGKTSRRNQESPDAPQSLFIYHHMNYF